MRVLTWNLKHGRAEPPARGSLLHAFAATLAAWPWDVALLQEVPPWWPLPLARACGAQWRRVLTSRNAGLPARRALANRWPELMKSNGGGANAILVRGAEVVAHRRRRLCWWPERRWVHGVWLSSGAFSRGQPPGSGWSLDGLWVANLHATAHDTPAAVRDGRAAAASVLGWSGALPCVLGGDFNLRRPDLPGLHHAGGHDVDHIFVSEPPSGNVVTILERGALSDHAPVLVDL